MNNIDNPIAKRFALNFDWNEYRRSISKKDVVIHCHHYNSRIQRTIEDVKQIDGKALFISSAEAVFSEMCMNSIFEKDDEETKWNVAANLYAHLGYGMLDFCAIDRHIVSSQYSHFVEGWRAGFSARETPVCSFTQGYLQGVYFAITGKSVHVHEKQCMIHGADECVFEIDLKRDTPQTVNTKRPMLVPSAQEPYVHPVQNSNIDYAKILSALVEMPVFGDEEGLIPAFGVYLANTPADFYNLVCIRFVEEMEKVKLKKVATSLLQLDAETCGLNTFRGIMNSAEWEGLIAPMCTDKRDELFGVLAVSNGLGWGQWQVASLIEGQSLELVSFNGYEAKGYCEYRNSSKDSRCYMLTGVAAGIVELIYGKGAFEDRFGLYSSTEDACTCQGYGECKFRVRSNK